LPDSSPSSLLPAPSLTLSFPSTKAATFGSKKVIAEEVPVESYWVNSASPEILKKNPRLSFSWVLEVGNSWALMGLRSYLNKVSRKGTTFLKKGHFLIAKKRKESKGFLSFFLPPSVWSLERD
jgi:hypothetical protein